MFKLLYWSFAAIMLQAWVASIEIISRLQLAMLMFYWMALIRRIQLSPSISWKLFIFIYIVLIAFFDIIHGGITPRIIVLDMGSYLVAKVFYRWLSTKRAHLAMCILMAYSCLSTIYYAIPPPPPPPSSLKNNTIINWID